MRFGRLMTAILGFVVYYGCGPVAENSNQVVQRVKATKVEIQDLVPRVQSFGSLSFKSKADVSAAVEGTIQQILVKEGSGVTAGTLLARLDNVQLQIRKTQAEKELNSALSSLELAKAQFWESRLQFESRRLNLVKTESDIRQKRLELDDLEKTLRNKEKLFTIDGISEQELNSLKLKVSSAQTEYQALLTGYETQKIGLRDQDIISFGSSVPSDEESKRKLLEQINTTIPAAQVKVAESNVEKARGDLGSVNQLLDELSIRSPIEGVLGAKYLEVGERVSPGAKLFTVFDASNVQAVFPVQEDEGVKLSQGLTVKVWIDALGPDPRNGRIENISPLIDPQSGNFTIKATLDNWDRKLKPGMFMRASIDYGKARKALMVPLTVIVEKKGPLGSVFAIMNHRLFGKKVKLGQEDKNNVEILDGINDTDLLVDTPSPLLKEGDRVEY